MPTIFQNPGVASITALTTMGLSAKEGDNPIGRFGTGFKFAVATILRNGGRVNVWRGEEHHEFSTKEIEERGSKFDLVLLDGVSCGFTTMLGRDWELWQAFRELHSNALDEGGDSAVREFTGPTAGETMIVVNSPQFERVALKKHEVFLSTPAILATGHCSIHKANADDYFYVNGVRASLGSGQGGKKTLYTYNITIGPEHGILSEDRLIKEWWSMERFVADALTSILDADSIRRIITAKDDHYENGISFYGDLPPEWIDVAADLHARGETFNQTVRERLLKARPHLAAPKRVDLDEVQDGNLHKAENLLEAAGIRGLEKIDIYPVEAGTYSYRFDKDILYVSIRHFESAAALAALILLAKTNIEIRNSDSNQVMVDVAYKVSTEAVKQMQLRTKVFL